MAKKNQRTTCSAIEWPQFIYLLERLKRKQDFRLLMIMAMGGFLGLRVSDIRKRKWSELLNKDKVEITEGKTGKTRFITINPTFKELIDFAYNNLHVPPDKYIICNKKGAPLTIQHINRMLHAVFDEYNIKGPTSSHSLRKTFGKRIYTLNQKSEASLIILSKIFNHSTTAITRAYLGITEEEISDIYLQM